LQAGRSGQAYAGGLPVEIGPLQGSQRDGRRSGQSIRPSTVNARQTILEKYTSMSIPENVSAALTEQKHEVYGLRR
jgi:hypothetical protein